MIQIVIRRRVAVVWSVRAFLFILMDGSRGWFNTLLQNLKRFQSGGDSVLPHLGACSLSDVLAIRVVVSTRCSLAVKGKFPSISLFLKCKGQSFPWRTPQWCLPLSDLEAVLISQQRWPYCLSNTASAGGTAVFELQQKSRWVLVADSLTLWAFQTLSSSWMKKSVFELVGMFGSFENSC